MKNLIYYKVLFLMIGITLAGANCNSPDKAPEKTATLEPDDAVLVDVHEPTGLVMDATFPLIIANCTSCHSAKLITQNRATREGWASMIDWMQATQGLWKFDEHEPQILDYLAKYYGPTETGRRVNLTVEEWYDF